MPQDQANLEPGILPRGGGPSIAYHRTAGRAPGVVFMGGFRSDMTGSKALSLEAFCRSRGQAFLRFDYSGHGRSEGEFTDGTISSWLADSLAALDQLTEGPQILVGSSMGGWIALLAALARPARLAGLVGIAAAPDFTEELMWPNMAPPVRRALIEQGVIYRPSAYGDGPYPITRALIEDGRRHLLLGGPIAIPCPVRLVHGKEDPDVPWQTSQRLADRLESTDVKLILVDGGGHRLSDPKDLELINAQVAELS